MSWHSLFNLDLEQYCVGTMKREKLPPPTVVEITLRRLRSGYYDNVCQAAKFLAAWCADADYFEALGIINAAIDEQNATARFVYNTS